MIDHVKVLVVLNQCKAPRQVNHADEGMLLDDFSEIYVILYVNGLVATALFNLNPP